MQKMFSIKFKLTKKPQVKKSVDLSKMRIKIILNEYIKALKNEEDYETLTNYEKQLSDKIIIVSSIPTFYDLRIKNILSIIDIVNFSYVTNLFRVLENVIIQTTNTHKFISNVIAEYSPNFL